MLDKDQYNQEEYNDYYQQEIQGAETSGVRDDDDSSKGKGGIFILLGLVLLGVAGYFGYKTLTASEKSGTSDETLIVQKETTTENSEKPQETTQTKEEEKTTVEAPTKAIQTVETTQKEEPISNNNKEVETVTNSVQSAMGNEQKMSPEEIAKVVQMVMSQMNNKIEKTETVAKENPEVLVEDKNLISSLSGTDVDSVKSDDDDKKLEESLNNIKETTKDTNINKDSVEVDTYNKVKVEENSGDDELSKLSNQISSLISDKKSSDQTNGSTAEKTYTESLKKEVVTRKNEMRIIVVRKGDTLGRIAKRAYGNVMEYRKIYQANPDILKRPDRIYIGQKLRIPK
jgi:nucleoid-associated protein YgaU